MHKRSLILLAGRDRRARRRWRSPALATGGRRRQPRRGRTNRVPGAGGQARRGRLGRGPAQPVLDLTFMRDGDDWQVAQKGGYPADAGKVRRIVLAMADMTLVEPKTRKPDLYPRLEVEDPGKGKSTLVTLKDKSGAALARLIVGKRRYDRLGAGNDGVYVRRPGDPQSWLARGSIDFSDDMASWLDRHIVDIPDSRVAKVSLTQPDGTSLMLSRAKPDAKFAADGRAGQRQVQERHERWASRRWRSKRSTSTMSRRRRNCRSRTRG